MDIWSVLCVLMAWRFNIRASAVMLTGTSPVTFWVLGPITLNIFKDVCTAGTHWNFIKTLKRSHCWKELPTRVHQWPQCWVGTHALPAVDGFIGHFSPFHAESCRSHHRLLHIYDINCIRQAVYRSIISLHHVIISEWCVCTREWRNVMFHSQTQ